MHRFVSSLLTSFDQLIPSSPQENCGAVCNATNSIIHESSNVSCQISGARLCPSASQCRLHFPGRPHTQVFSSNWFALPLHFGALGICDSAGLQCSQQLAYLVFLAGGESGILLTVR